MEGNLILDVKVGTRTVQDVPVLRMPPDILSTIFRELQPIMRSKYKLPYEVAMTHVCNHWREIALATPLLWSNIDVNSPKSLHCVSSYLERSKSCPIDVKILWLTVGSLDPTDAVTQIMPIIDLLTKHAIRWQTLLVYTSHSIITNAILSRMKDLVAPWLQRLQVKDDQDVSMGYIPLPIAPSILIGGAPKLVTLSTNNATHIPPFENLTTLHLDISRFRLPSGIDGNFLLSLVCACPSLSTLSIYGKFSGEWTVENVTMPTIRSLRFDNNETFAGKFLVTVKLPNLDSLALSCAEAHYQIVNMLYSHHPLPSFPVLKYLTLQSFDYYASEKYAKVFPTVSAILFKSCNSFHLLFVRQLLEDMEYWPNLQTLAFHTLREKYAAKFSTLLSEIVILRRLGGKPIRRVFLNRELLALVTTTDTIQAHTSLEELDVDNCDDPWRIISNTYTGDQR